MVEVRLNYTVTIDERERDGLEGVLSICASTSMLAERSGPAAAATAGPSAPQDDGALQLEDGNGNGRITCTEARKHRINPVSRGHLAYELMNDGDGDGIVCD